MQNSAAVCIHISMYRNIYARREAHAMDMCTQNPIQLCAGSNTIIVPLRSAYMQKYDECIRMHRSPYSNASAIIRFIQVTLKFSARGNRFVYIYEALAYYLALNTQMQHTKLLFNLRILYLFRSQHAENIFYNKFNIPDVFSLMLAAHETFSSNSSLAFSRSCSQSGYIQSACVSFYCSVQDTSDC